MLTGEDEKDEDVTGDAMVLVQCFAVVDTANKVREVELHQADTGVEEQENVGDKPKTSMS